MFDPRLVRVFSAGIAASILLLAGVLPATAAESTSDGKWEYKAQVYLWGAGIGVSTAAGDDIDISFSDLLKNLDMALMASLVAKKDKWAIFSDIIYLNVSSSQKSTANIIDIPVKVKVDAGIKAWIVTAGGAYEFMQTENTSLNFLAGARYLNLETPLKFKIGNAINRKVTPKGEFWDGIIGVRGETRLNEKWYLTYYLDVGKGDTDLTYQAVAGAGYKFSKVDAMFGYRYLDWDFKDDSPLDSLDVSGPYAGVRWRF